MTKKSFIFDLDGTLADTLPLCIFAFQEALELVSGRRPTKQEVMHYFGYAEKGITQSLCPNNWEGYYDTYLKIYNDYHHMCPKPFDGIKNILDYMLDNEYKIAMVTGKGSDTANITLEKYGIKHYFEYVETGSPQGSIKPECIKKIINKWNASSENVFYIGDTHTDIIDSNKAGVLPIAVSWASTSDHNKLLAHNPHLIFKEIQEFYNWLIQ